MLLLFVCHDTGGCTMSMIQVSFCLCICYSYPMVQTAKSIIIYCLAWQHALVDPQLVHAFAGDPEDAISRKRRLHLEHERHVCSDATPMHCSIGQGKIAPCCSVLLCKTGSQHACATAITPMEICSSYRCAVLQDQCTAALVRAK